MTNLETCVEVPDLPKDDSSKHLADPMLLSSDLKPSGQKKEENSK